MANISQSDVKTASDPLAKSNIEATSDILAKAILESTDEELIQLNYVLCLALKNIEVRRKKLRQQSRRKLVSLGGSELV